MSLCGAVECGCGVISTPATSGAIAGAFPTVTVLGNGSSINPYQFRMNPAWTAAVAALAPGAEWVDYTPIVAQGVTTDIAKTILYAKYARTGLNGKTVIADVSLQVSGTGTAGSPATITLPVTSVGTAVTTIGAGSILDVSAASRLVVCAELTSTTTSAFVDSGSGSSYWGASPAVAIAGGDQIRVSLTYEGV